MTLSIEFGLCAKELSEQLADFNLPKEKIEVWQGIADFIITAHISHAATDKTVTKLNKLLGSMISQEIKRRMADDGT